MAGKELIKFLFFGSVINKKNISSLLIVAVFFGIYVLTGGKVGKIPRKEEALPTFDQLSTPGEENFQSFQPPNKPDNTSLVNTDNLNSEIMRPDAEASKIVQENSQAVDNEVVVDPELERKEREEALNRIEEKLKRLQVGAKDELR